MLFEDFGISLERQRKARQSGIDRRGAESAEIFYFKLPRPPCLRGEISGNLRKQRKEEKQSILVKGRYATGQSK